MGQVCGKNESEQMQGSEGVPIALGKLIVSIISSF
jgi:hypothetical protein